MGMIWGLREFKAGGGGGKGGKVDGCSTRICLFVPLEMK